MSGLVAPMQPEPLSCGFSLAPSAVAGGGGTGRLGGAAIAPACWPSEPRAGGAGGAGGNGTAARCGGGPLGGGGAGDSDVSAGAFALVPPQRLVSP